jgi:DNA repair exonuclease SbcCD ATPase subunit
MNNNNAINDGSVIINDGTYNIIRTPPEYELVSSINQNGSGELRDRTLKEIKEYYGTDKIICPCMKKTYTFTSQTWLQHCKSINHNRWKNGKQTEHITIYGHCTSPEQIIDVLNKQLRDYKILHSRTTEQFQRCNVQLQRSTGQLEIYLNNINNLNDEKNSLILEVKALQEELKSTKKDLKSTKKELTLTKNELKLTKNELKSIQDQLELTQNELEITEKQLETTQEQFETTQEQLETTQEQFETMQEQFETALKQLTDNNNKQKVLTRKLENRCKTILDLKRENNRLTDELNTTREHLETYKILYDK